MAETSSLRFPALEKPVNEFIQEQEDKKTPSKTRRDIAILMAFLKEKNEVRKLEEIPPEQLNDFLSEFVITVKEKRWPAWPTLGQPSHRLSNAKSICLQKSFMIEVN